MATRLGLRATTLPLAVCCAALALGRTGSTAAAPEPDGAPVRIEARMIDRAGGQEAGWGVTGQILVPQRPDDPALLRWRPPERAAAVSSARQSLTLAPGGGAGLIRVGREIPFAGWFLRHGVACGWVEAKSEWREVSSALGVETLALQPDGGVRLLLTPEFSFLDGRVRRTVSFPGERVEIVLSPGVEARLDPADAQRAFYGRLLAGYDPLRRVWPVELLLRLEPAEYAEP